MTTKLYFCKSYDVVAFIKSLIKQNKLNTGTFTVLYRKSGWGKLLRRFFLLLLYEGEYFVKLSIAQTCILA